jgi:hypothetical protein
MRDRIVLRLDAKSLEAVRRQAAGEGRRLENYVEMLIRRDLDMAPTLEVIAPDDIDEYVAVPLPGETRRERRLRDALFRTILKAGKRPTAKR